jgi:AcrR family transcriptional regulator
LARTQAADYDERRDAIVAKAAELYARFGFLGCSISDLAHACGVSKSLLYHYFSSKEDILFEIMDGHVRALATAAAKTEAEADPAKRLRALTRGFMALYVDAAAAHKVLVNDLDKLPPKRRASVVAAERALIETVDGLIKQLSRKLAVRAQERRMATMMYFGMINWTHTWFDPGGPIKGQAFADQVVDTFLDGLPA